MRSLLRWTGEDLPVDARAKVAVFRCFLLALVAVESWERAARLGGGSGSGRAVALALVASAAAAASWRPALSQAATAATMVALAIDFAFQFPACANHQYLQLVCLAFLLLLRDEVDPEVVLQVAALRWLLVAGLFWAGMQKLLFGYYFEGELLAFTIPENPRFAAILQLALSPAELERLSRIVIQEGAGPFRVESWLFLGVSNLAWAAELVLPALLLIPATRRLAVFGTLAYFAAIESAAREVFFGGIMAALALGFGPPRWLRVAQPFLYAGLAALLATTFGLLPSWFFT